ncbi:hypothetical protein KKG31_03185 [Patescibacteria group bacterium]|nr:hypothetical protein [Patescibacteria group bacterium]MBU1758161.1 hypothetical protein [Patescibacteria group bacterium]
MTNKDIISAELVRIMEILGKKVVVYTVNTQEEFQKVYEMGVRNIITDDVVLLKKAIKNFVGINTK